MISGTVPVITADDRMIKEVYEHLTKTDKIKAVKKEKERMTGIVADDTLDGEIIAEKTRENYKLKKQITKLETEKETSEFNAMTFLEQTKYINDNIKQSYEE